MVAAREGLKRLRDALDRPVDSASLVFFRVAFGCAMVVLAARFFTHGWIDADYRAPKVFFHYWGFGWVRPWPGIGMYLHYAVMAVAAACFAAGIVQRPAALVFALTSTYAHFCDKSNYLNHYYLVSLLSALCVLLPSDGRKTVPAWLLWLFRFQVGVVYVFGGVAKIGSDWLFHAEPLRIWLSGNAEMPILGRYFDRPWMAFAFSWAGMLFDLTIVGWLSWRRTRRYAYAVVVVFHVLTSLLFHIGMFPWLMMINATLFFDPAWCRRWLGPGKDIAPRPIPAFGVYALAAYAALQIAAPLRFLAYPGNTLWTEEGFRFAWKVMLVEKSGDLEFTVVERDGRRSILPARDFLTPFQTRQASTQPDMILELAHVIAARSKSPVQVFARARVAFNGRPAALLIDPNVDLAQEEDTLAPKRWILPAPSSEPQF